MIEVRKHSCRQDTKGQWLVTIEIHPEDHANELVLAAKDTIFNISYEVADGDESRVVMDSIDTEQRGNHSNRVEGDSRTLGERIRTRAVLLCKDERFQEWIRSLRSSLLEICEIKSRSELATNELAQKRFLELERRYREETGQVAEVRG